MCKLLVLNSGAVRKFYCGQKLKSNQAGKEIGQISSNNFSTNYYGEKNTLSNITLKLKIEQKFVYFTHSTTVAKWLDYQALKNNQLGSNFSQITYVKVIKKKGMIGAYFFF